MLAVINKNSLMRRRLCGRLHGGRLQLLFGHRSNSKILVENCDFRLPSLAFSTPARGIPLEYSYDVWYGKN